MCLRHKRRRLLHLNHHRQCCVGRLDILYMQCNFVSLQRFCTYHLDNLNMNPHGNHDIQIYIAPRDNYHKLGFDNCMAQPNPHQKAEQIHSYLDDISTVQLGRSPHDLCPGTNRNMKHSMIYICNNIVDSKSTCQVRHHHSQNHNQDNFCVLMRFLETTVNLLFASWSGNPYYQDMYIVRMLDGRQGHRVATRVLSTLP